MKLDRSLVETSSNLISLRFKPQCVASSSRSYSLKTHLSKRFLPIREKAFEVLLTEVSLNEKREEIAKLTAEIEHINPDILNLTDQELHDINLKMAEDVKILAEKISNSPSGANSGDNGRKEVDISESLFHS